MKIECPDCRLSGNINEVELPEEGRYMSCPRCKTSFHVAKPPLPADSRYLMNTCPVCQYSTFTDEMFAVCPKCGHSGKDYKKVLKKKEKAVDQALRQDLPPLQENMEQLKRDLGALQRSHRNPDLVTAPLEGTAPERSKAPEPVRWTGWLSIAAGAALFCYGFAGLINYYSEDWQAILSEPLLEPLSKTRVFFSLGFLPWLRTLVGVWFIVVASQFLNLQSWGRKELTRCAWGGLALGVLNEIVGFIDWARISSSSPSFSYYAVGVISSLFMVLIWCIPSLALLWYLQRESILRAFPEN
jgi:predicted Zn finger-like uncharacterized protein